MSDSRPCPVCASRHAHFEIDVAPERLSGSSRTPGCIYRYLRCETCDAAFLSRMPTPGELAPYYESDEYHLELSHEGRLTPLRRAQLELARPLPKGPPGRHLDFGCGPGDYLAFSRAHGWDCMGVEYSDESARTARRHFPVVLASELEALPDAAFDHISMLHSLEHVERPLETLSLLARKLKPGGTLFVEVPYLDCLEYRIFRRHYAMIQAPLHLQFFSDRTMAFMAPNAGLKLHRVRDNLWTPVHYVWSFLNAIDAPIDRRRKITLNTLLFPLVLPPVAVGSALGIPGVARQYTFTRADRAGSDTRPRAIPVRFERR